MSDEWRRVNELFHAALERPPAERAAFVLAEARGDTALRDEVLSLVDAHDRAGDAFLQSPAIPSSGNTGLFPAGAVVGNYHIERELGRGGMGVVYLAEDDRLGRKVALKALAPRYTHDEPRRERLRKEARSAARLSHPGIATVYALEEIDGELFIACEYVPGRTLREELDAGVMPVDRMLDIAAQIARALAAAHADHVVHRDLKPENVVVGERAAVKILDFGVARSHAPGDRGAARLTEAGTIVGTPGYMSPEQIDGRDVDFRSDIFSFGVLLYELATGVHPFEGSSATSTIARILTVDPCPPGQLRPLPAEFDRIVRKCLYKRAEDRYQSTSDVAADLEQVAGVLPRGGRAGGAASDEIAVPAGDVSGSSAPAAAARPAADRSRWWRVHQMSVVLVYAAMTAVSWLSAEMIGTEVSTLLLFACVAAAALNGTLRVHLLFTERHNPPAFRGELRRATPWLRGSDVVFGLLLMAFAVLVMRPHVSIAILLAAVGAGSIIASAAVEPATTDAAFPRRSSGVRRRTPSGSRDARNS